MNSILALESRKLKSDSTTEQKVQPSFWRKQQAKPRKSDTNLLLSLGIFVFAPDLQL
jgi:hypothetical protein